MKLEQNYKDRKGHPTQILPSNSRLFANLKLWETTLFANNLSCPPENRTGNESIYLNGIQEWRSLLTPLSLVRPQLNLTTTKIKPRIEHRQMKRKLSILGMHQHFDTFRIQLRHMILFRVNSILLVLLVFKGLLRVPIARFYPMCEQPDSTLCVKQVVNAVKFIQVPLIING